MPNKIIVHACGGAGINIADQVINKVSELGEGFSNIEFQYVDTSTSNIDKITPRGEFFKITAQSYGAEKIDGSGGSRQKHAADITKNMPTYMNTIGIHKRVTGEYHMVVFSGSGGSGSVIGPVLIKHLMERDIPTIAVVIGDSSNAAYTKSTIGTISTLDNFAISAKKPLSVIYVNNHGLSTGITHSEAEKQANKQLLNTISLVSLFLSNEHESLDYSDMVNIVDQSQHKTIWTNEVAENLSGLYGLAVYSKEIKLISSAHAVVPVAARGLGIGDVEADTNVELMQYKKGKITLDNPIKIYKDLAPLFMVAYANFFSAEHAALTQSNENYQNILKTIQNGRLPGTPKSTKDEATGLVF
jgi:cell division GTPase FtsZ